MGGIPTQEAAAYLANRAAHGLRPERSAEALSPGLLAYCERTAERAAEWAHEQDPRCPRWSAFDSHAQRALATSVLTHIAIQRALTMEPIP